LKGKYDWRGMYLQESGTLVFTRIPTADQISSKVPAWARQIVVDESVVPKRLDWLMELTVRQAPETSCPPVLVGKWFPGEIAWREEYVPYTNETHRTAHVVGRGTPLTVVYSRVDLGPEGFEAVEQLLDQLDERRATYAKAFQLKRDLDLTLHQAASALDEASDVFAGIDNIDEILAESIETMQTWEDCVGLIALGAMGLKMAVKQAAKSPAFRRQAAKLLGNSPTRLLAFDRALAVVGEQTPEWMAKTMDRLDRLRLESVAKTVNELGLAEQIRLTGSGRKVFAVEAQVVKEGRVVSTKVIQTAEDLEELRAGVTGGTVTVSMRVKSPEDIAALRNAGDWKGTISDIDIQIPHAEERRFLDRVTQTVNDAIKADTEVAWQGAIAKVDDLEINTFTKNLAEVDISTAGGMKDYLGQLIRRRYLAQSGAYRTRGSQELARFYTRVETDPPVSLTGIDGADIVCEMTDRVEMIWNLQNAVDPKVFKDIYKDFERALVGADTARTNGTVLSDWKDSVKAAVEALPDTDPRKALYQEAEELNKLLNAPEPTRSQKLMDRARVLAESMVDRMKAMRAEAERMDFPAVPPERKSVSDYGRMISRHQVTGQLDERLALTTLEQAKIHAGDRIATELLAEQIPLSRLTVAALDPRLTAALGRTGFGQLALNPFTLGFAAGVQLQRYFKDDRLMPKLETHAEEKAKAAAAHLRRAEELWGQLVPAVDQIKHMPPGDVSVQANQLLKGVPSDRRDCASVMMKSALADVVNEYHDVTGFVAHVQFLRTHLTADELRRLVADSLGLPTLNQQVQEANTQKDKLYEPIQQRLDAAYKRGLASSGYEGQAIMESPEYQAYAAVRQRHEELSQTRDAYQQSLEVLPKGMAFVDLATALETFTRAPRTLAQLGGYYGEMRNVVRSAFLEADEHEASEADAAPGGATRPEAPGPK